MCAVAIAIVVTVFAPEPASRAVSVSELELELVPAFRPVVLIVAVRQNVYVRLPCWERKPVVDAGSPQNSPYHESYLSRSCLWCHPGYFYGCQPSEPSSG